MFTLEQIKNAHSQVKSGADFPKYVQDLIGLGINRYEFFVSDGHLTYYGTNGFELTAASKWEERPIAADGDKELFIRLLKEHQQGKSDYPTFCLQSAECGVEKWIVDMDKMTCVYYDKVGGEMLIENIPSV